MTWWSWSTRWLLFRWCPLYTQNGTGSYQPRFLISFAGVITCSFGAKTQRTGNWRLIARRLKPRCHTLPHSTPTPTPYLISRAGVCAGAREVSVMRHQIYTLASTWMSLSRPTTNHKMLWDSKRSVCIKTPRKPWLSNWSIVDFRPISTCAIFSKNPGTPITYNINRSLRHATSHQIALSLKRRSYKWFKVQKKTWLVICFLFPLIWQFFFAFSQISRISCPVAFGPIAGRHGRRWHRGIGGVAVHGRLSGLRCRLRCQSPFVFLLNPLRGLLTRFFERKNVESRSCFRPAKILIDATTGERLGLWGN